MSYVRLSPTIEYDPRTLMIRENGQERPAGFAGICYAFREEVLRELGATAVTVGDPALDAPEGLPADTPRDPRDGVPAGSGQVTESGAPKTVPNRDPCPNQYGYIGPAACNPYFSNPGNPLRQGYVKGFDKWFERTQVVDVAQGEAQYVVNPAYCATAEGAREALRLVHLFEPAARVDVSWFGAEAGPFRADKPTYEIVLPNGARLNAGGILWNYYQGGTGVLPASDRDLRAALEWAYRLPPQTS